MRDIYNANGRTRKEGIEEDIGEMKDLLCLWSFRINIMKTAISKNDLEIQLNLHQNPENIFLETNKSNPKIDVEHRLWEAMRKKKKGCKYTKLDFK